jgi:hypothetical protein
MATMLSQKMGDEDGSSARSNKSSSLNDWTGEDSIAAIDMAVEVSGGAHMPLVNWLSPSDTWEENDKDDPLKSEEGESSEVKDLAQEEFSDEAAVRREAQNSPDNAGESTAPSSQQPQEPGERLSEADMTYLAHQNRILLKHAKQVERRPIKHLDASSGSQSSGTMQMDYVV